MKEEPFASWDDVQAAALELQELVRLLPLKPVCAGLSVSLRVQQLDADLQCIHFINGDLAVDLETQQLSYIYWTGHHLYQAHY